MNGRTEGAVPVKISKFHELLRHRTSEAHERLENSVFFKKLFSLKLERWKFVLYLESLLRIHMAYESQFDQCCGYFSQNQELASIWSSDLAKVPFLKRDIALLLLSDDKDDDQKSTLQQAQLHHHFPLQFQLDQLVERISRQAKKSPLYLLAYLYVFEGSQNGGLHLKKIISRSYGCSPVVISYFGCYGDKTYPYWRSKMQQFNSLQLTINEKNEVVLEANEIFNFLNNLATAIDSLQ